MRENITYAVKNIVEKKERGKGEENKIKLKRGKTYERKRVTMILDEKVV